MPQFKTLQFPNTAAGQSDKVSTLEREAANGWRVVSETIVAGKFKGEKACCFFLIFAPCAFLAGHEPDMITVTLERSDQKASSLTGGDAIQQTPSYDRVKWNALRQYDAEIAAAVDEVESLGPKWREELASAYMAISDKAYLGAIVAKLKVRAAAELEVRKADELRQASTMHASEGASGRAGLQDEDDGGEGMRIGVAIFIVIAIVLAVLVLSHTSRIGYSPGGGVTSTPKVADIATPQDPLEPFHYLTGLNVNGDNWLALRSEPSSKSGYRIKKMGPDTLLDVTETRGTWSRVRLRDGAAGWAASQYIACCKAAQ